MNGITTIEADESLAGGGLYRATRRRLRRGRRGGEGAGLHSFHPGELENILCIEEERVAGLDDTVRYEGRRLQIPPNRNQHHFAKSTIRVLDAGTAPSPCSMVRAKSTASERRNPERKSKAEKEFVA